MSSIVTSPAVPPYSSLTMAMCVRLDWNSRSCASMRFETGMNVGGRTSDPPSVRRLLVGDDRRQHVLRVQDADDVVERLAKHGQPRVLRAANAVEHLGPRRVGVDADDVHARHHDLLHLRFAEREHAVDQLFFGRRHLGLGRDDFAELLGRRLAILVVRRRRRNHQVERAIDHLAERHRWTEDEADESRQRLES